MCLYYLSLEKDQSIFFQNDISFFSADGWATAIEVGFFLHAIHRKCIIAIFKHFTLELQLKDEEKKRLESARVG